MEGVTKCGACHDFVAGARAFKCLDCHSEIRHRLDAHAGFHARAYKAANGQTDCTRCHMEHNGESFPLIRLDRRGFDHAAQTGFALEGRHRGQPCEACHNEKKISASMRAEIKIKDLSRTFLGLRRECASCHEDRHRGEEGSDCTHCHAQDSWKPVPGFSHGKTPFALTGMHQTVECRKCHIARAGETAILFKGLQFSGCQNCHADPHHGAFQEIKLHRTCDGCHNTAGWKNNRPSAGFDHNTTRFSLIGKHAEAACSACHKTDDFHRPLAHERCRDCHEDPHRGQFSTRAAGSDCSACHSETGFKPSKFSRKMHDAAFPLDGKHATLACKACHQPEGRDAVYVTGKRICSACHADRHGGAFAAAPLANRCELCHTTAGFQPSTFSVTRHAGTRFPLTGRHAAVPCANCHKPLQDVSGQPRRYQFEDLSCKACHADPHGASVACETCHSGDAWKTVGPFDHSATKFRLEGAHAAVKCAQCHLPADTAGAPRFSGASDTCASCHASKDPHSAQFRTGGRDEDCSTCHVTVRWDGAAFNHDRARFTLDVAHRNVPCAKCHKERLQPDGKQVRVYRGTSTECVQCH